MNCGFYGKATNQGRNSWKMEFFNTSSETPIFTCYCGKMKKQDAQKEALIAFRDFLKMKGA